MNFHHHDAGTMVACSELPEPEFPKISKTFATFWALHSWKTRDNFVLYRQLSRSTYRKWVWNLKTVDRAWNGRGGKSGIKTKNQCRPLIFYQVFIGSQVQKCLQNLFLSELKCPQMFNLVLTSVARCLVAASKTLRIWTVLIESFILRRLLPLNSQ